MSVSVIVFLGFIVGLSIANTIAVFFAASKGPLPQQSPASRAVDATITFVVGVWALALLLKYA